MISDMLDILLLSGDGLNTLVFCFFDLVPVLELQHGATKGAGTCDQDRAGLIGIIQISRDFILCAV
jgi:hypothetical protein